MLTLYHAPRTRSVRIRWLLEELGLPHRLERIEFAPPSAGTFAQATPLGKIPVLVDEGVAFSESGAILQYVLERHAGGRLAPPVGSPQRGPFLQWIHFAEGTAYPPLGVIIYHTLYRNDAIEHPAVIEASRERARQALGFLEQHFGAGPYVLGEFSAADIMLMFTLLVARVLGVLGDDLPKLVAYVARMEARPAFQRAMAD